MYVCVRIYMYTSVHAYRGLRLMLELLFFEAQSLHPSKPELTNMNSLPSQLAPEIPSLSSKTGRPPYLLSIYMDSGNLNISPFCSPGKCLDH